jgi:hypothetical protein
MIISPDFVAYEQKCTAASALRADALPLNKSALFDALVAAAIQTVVIEFDGCGDSGQLENITGLGAENTEIPLPEDEIEMQEVQFEGPSISVVKRTVRDVLETLAYDFLDQTHDGWENGDGAHGEFTFDVATRSITLDYNERFTDSTNYQHEF